MVVRRPHMDNDIQDRLDRIESSLKALEKLGKDLKDEMEEVSANVLASGQMSGADRKLDEILDLLRAK
jgi:hypothetical protein